MKIFYQNGYLDLNGNAQQLINLTKENEKHKLFIASNESEIVEIANNVMLVPMNLAYKYIYEADIILSDVQPPLKLREDQISVCIWHGTPIKTQNVKKQQGTMPWNWKYILHQTDYFVSQGSFMDEVIRNDFGFQGEILKTGYPKNQILFKKQQKTKKILFAPTWRGNDWKNGKLDYTLKLNEIKKEFSDYQIIMKIHPLCKIDPVQLKEIEDLEIIISDKEITKLYAESDLLITDFSSAVFDFSITKKPVILYLDGIESYRNDIGLTFEPEEVFPEICVRNTEECISLMHNFLNTYKTPSVFFDKFINYEKKSNFIETLENLINQEPEITFENSKTTGLIYEKYNVDVTYNYAKKSKKITDLSELIWVINSKNNIKININNDLDYFVHLIFSRFKYFKISDYDTQKANFKNTEAMRKNYINQQCIRHLESELKIQKQEVAKLIKEKEDIRNSYEECMQLLNSKKELIKKILKG